MSGEPSSYLTQVYLRALSSQDPALVQISFDVAVIDKYRDAPAYSLLRSDTVGRVKREGGWTLDVGLAEDGRTVHACLGDVMRVLPEEERDHWARHVASLPLSSNFLQMRLAAGACIDDGEVRPWE